MRLPYSQTRVMRVATATMRVEEVLRSREGETWKPDDTDRALEMMRNVVQAQMAASPLGGRNKAGA